MKNVARENWIEQARNVAIEDEVANRGIKLSGRRPHLFAPTCPLCGYKGVDCFTVNTSKRMFWCRKCEVGGDVIALVEHVDGVDFNQAVETLTNESAPRRQIDRAQLAERDRVEAVENMAYARRIWAEARQIADTIAEVYLRETRGIKTCALPPSLRFAPRLRHRSITGTVSHWPGMVALVTRGIDSVPIAIHRTFLSPAGGQAEVNPVKMALAATAGGAVRLAPATEFLMIGEGIETCLAAMQATGLPAWAALSTSGLGALDLPEGVREVIMLADNDVHGQGERAAINAALRWKREGRRVRVALPPQGGDFNDVLLAEAAS